MSEDACGIAEESLQRLLEVIESLNDVAVTNLAVDSGRDARDFCAAAESASGIAGIPISLFDNEVGTRAILVPHKRRLAIAWR